MISISDMMVMRGRGIDTVVIALGRRERRNNRISNLLPGRCRLPQTWTRAVLGCGERMCEIVGVRQPRTKMQ